LARHGPTPGGGWCSTPVVGADPAARRSNDTARARARIGWGEKGHAAAGVAPAERGGCGGGRELVRLGAFQQQHAPQTTTCSSSFEMVGR